MGYHTKHLFFCINQRKPGKKCCLDAGADDMRDYAKSRLKALKIPLGPGGVRVNKSGCLGRCNEGPVLVIYPEGVWYTYETRADIDEILEKHVIGGEIVARLLLPKL